MLDPVRHTARALGHTPLRIIATVLLTGALVSGCGSDDSNSGKNQNSAKDEATKSATDRALPPNIVTDKAIDAQKEDTATRALLEWWQAFQFRDAKLVVRLTSERTVDAVGRSRFEKLVRQVGPGLQGLDVLSSRDFGDVSSVRVVLLSFGARKGESKPPTKPTSLTPSSFVMRRESGRRWLFDDSEYLRQLAKNLDL